MILILIVPYYSVIGGWVIKYLFEYLLGHGQALAADDYFSGFISNWIFRGDLLPDLHHVHSCDHLHGCPERDRASLKIYDADPRDPLRDHRGLLRDKTGRDGGRENISWFQTSKLLLDDRRLRDGADVLLPVDRDGNPRHVRLPMEGDTSIEDSTKNVEIFDTAIAIMAGLMIIPAVFAFSGGDPILSGWTFPHVHHTSEGICGHGIRNRHRDPVLFSSSCLRRSQSSIALTESAVSTFEG